MIHWTEKYVNAFFFIFYIYRLLANALWAVYICQSLEIANSLEEYRTFFPPLIGYFIYSLNFFSIYSSTSITKFCATSLCFSKDVLQII